MTFKANVGSESGGKSPPFSGSNVCTNTVVLLAAPQHDATTIMLGSCYSVHRFESLILKSLLLDSDQIPQCLSCLAMKPLVSPLVLVNTIIMIVLFLYYFIYSLKTWWYVWILLICLWKTTQSLKKIILNKILSFSWRCDIKLKMQIFTLLFNLWYFQWLFCVITQRNINVINISWLNDLFFFWF